MENEQRQILFNGICNLLDGDVKASNLIMRTVDDYSITPMDALRGITINSLNIGEKTYAKVREVVERGPLKMEENPFMRQRAITKSNTVGADRVIVLKKGAKYLIRIISDVNLSQSESENITNAFLKVIAGEAGIAIIEFDFELIQIVNE